jgi:hypothetical protein
MTVRLRVALAIIGLFVLCASLAAVVYAIAPNSYSTEQVPVAPTLFVPPQSFNGIWEAG